MSQVSPVLGLPYIQPAQAQKHVTHNEALALLDVLVQLAVVDHTMVTPPATPDIGDRYIVGAGGQGLWVGYDQHVAVWDGNLWNFHEPDAGWEAYSIAGDMKLRFDGTAWMAVSGATELEQLGINTTADTTNRLVVNAPATLLNHEGAGHQLKINKSLLSDTASLLFQTSFSGRAEMGTAGNDDFAIKVSADGTVWTTALTFDAASGIADGAAVQSTPTDVSVGKLARADYAYGPGNLLGPVSESAGVPTGAVIERGENANGAYVRMADGTQICWSDKFSVDITITAGAIFRSNSVSWTYPVVFSDTPALMQGRQNHSTAYWTVAGVTDATTAEACGMSWQSINNRAIYLVAIGRWF